MTPRRRRSSRWFAAGVAIAAFGGAAAVAVALAGTATLALAETRGPPLKKRYMGVNIATGSFAAGKLPGRYGYDYAYPTPAEAAPFLAAGMTAVRVPVIWERIQPMPGAALDPAEMDRLEGSLAALHGFDLVIIDLHNYGAYRHAKLDQPGGADLLADLWTRLATRYRGDRRIAFGLMNEPNAIPAPAWRTIAEQSLQAIRATGARNLVLVPGTDWSGAHSWESGNGPALADLRDPAKNMAFEMHQYADRDSSGTHGDCVAPDKAAARLAGATAWLRRNHARGFLGEFGTPPNPDCLAALDAMLKSVDAASDVWLGWTYWSAGAMWGGYPMSVQPDANGPKPQFAILERHIAR